MLDDGIIKSKAVKKGGRSDGDEENAKAECSMDAAGCALSSVDYAVSECFSASCECGKQFGFGYGS